MDEKRCTDCKQLLPATMEYWHRHKGRKDGLNDRCKICACQKVKEYQEANSEKVRAQQKASRSRPEARAHKQAYDQARLSIPALRERKQIQDRSYYQQNREHVLAQVKDYRNRSENRGRISARHKAYGIAYYHRPEVQEHRSIYYRQFRKRPERQAYERVKRHNRRTRARAILGTHTPGQIQEQLKRQKHKCYYCHARLKRTKGKYVYHIDHTFPLSRVVGNDTPANDISYLVLACPTCNMKKGDKFPWEWPEGGRLL